MEHHAQQSRYINISLIVVGLLLVLGYFYINMKHSMKTYVSRADGFSIKYPSSWERIENKDGAAAVFVSPLQNSLDVFRENVNVVVQDLSGHPMSLKNYTDTAILQIKVVFKSNIEITSEEDMYLASRPAYKFVYTIKSDMEIKMMHVWVIEGTRAYQVTFTGLTSQFDQYSDLVDKMIKSFRLR